MLIIPAIDLKDGKCVRLKQGRMEDDTVFSDDPVATAQHWVNEGARRLHLVDLNGEQPYPWDLLQPQDEMSRHRGAKRCRRYGLLGIISLLSPEYLLSVERWPSHLGPPDHYDRLSSLLDLSVLQSGWLLPLHSTTDFRPV